MTNAVAPNIIESVCRDNTLMKRKHVDNITAESESELTEPVVLAIDFFKKFKDTPGAQQMEIVDFFETTFRRDKRYRDIYLKILDDEVIKTETYLKMLKQKIEFVRDKEWSDVTIEGKKYKHKKFDMFAYKEDDLQMPVYFWNGKKWSKLVSDTSLISKTLEF